MVGRVRPSGDLAALCGSDFEREVLGRLLERGYRVTPQVGAMGYSIDMVVEGRGDQRLAIECDGDKYHGPERWADDMTRQRVLERVGWRFWRCWSSSFTIDPDGCMADLFGLLDRLGIHPAASETRERGYTEHRTRSQSSIRPAAWSTSKRWTALSMPRPRSRLAKRAPPRHLNGRRRPSSMRWKAAILLLRR